MQIVHGFDYSVNVCRMRLSQQISARERKEEEEKNEGKKDKNKKNMFKLNKLTKISSQKSVGVVYPEPIHGA